MMVITDVVDSKDEEQALAARPGADIIMGDGVEDAPRPDAANGDPAPGRGRGYVLDDEAGLDWLFGGAAGAEPGGAGIVLLDCGVAIEVAGDVDAAFLRRRRQRRRARRRT